MPHNSSLRSGDEVTLGGNRGRVYRFWSDHDRAWYFRVRVFEGPLRDAGRVWVSVNGWRPVGIDYEPAVEWNRCCACGWEFKAPKILPCGSEFCRRCMGGDRHAWNPDHEKDLQIAQAREQLDRELALLRQQGA